jgi:hypothetical protein
MPKASRPTPHQYFNSSPECWSVVTEVWEKEYSTSLLFNQVHQFTRAVREWSRMVWKAWSLHHAAIGQFVTASLPGLPR